MNARWSIVLTIATFVGAAMVIAVPADEAVEPDEAASRRLVLRSSSHPNRQMAVQSAVHRGLSWLSTQQNRDGSMAAKSEKFQLYTTAATVSALVSSGQQPRRGQYGDLMTGAVGHLLSLQQDDGAFSATVLAPRGREHATAALALCAVYDSSGGSEHRLGSAIERAVAYSGRVQHKLGTGPNDDGGWVYGPPRPATIPATVYELMFLRAAADAGFDVPQTWIDDALTFVANCYVPERTDPAMGVFAETVGSTKRRYHFTPMALLALQLHGRGNDPMALDAIQWLGNRNLPKLTKDVTKQTQIVAFYRHHYAGVQAMSQAGGENWKRFHTFIVDELLPLQAPDGRWGHVSEPYESQYGDVYNTAHAIMMLTSGERADGRTTNRSITNSELSPNSRRNESAAVDEEKERLRLQEEYARITSSKASSMSLEELRDAVAAARKESSEREAETKLKAVIQNLNKLVEQYPESRAAKAAKEARELLTKPEG